MGISKIKDVMNNVHVKRIMVVFVLLFLMLIASIPSFKSCTYEGHDLPFHFGRIQSIAESINNHQFPIRYESNAWHGHGYVSSLFYGNIFLYFPALLVCAGVPLYRAYNIYIIAVNVITVLVAYWSFSKMIKDSEWAVIGTVVYTLAGYRLTNIFVRAAVGEYTAMIFLPLCVYGIYRIYVEKENKPIKRVLPLVLGLSGVLQSHILTTELVAACMIIFAAINYKETAGHIKDMILAAVLVTLLNAFFIIPFIDSYFSMDLYINSKSFAQSIKGNGLYLSQLFGLVTKGTGYNAVWSTEHEECYRVGLLVLAMGLIVLIGLIKGVLKKNEVFTHKKDKYLLAVGVILLLMSWMATIYFPWDSVLKMGAFGRAISSVQYPCRFLGLQLICVVILGMFVGRDLVSKTITKAVVVILTLAIALGTTGIFDYTLSFARQMTDVAASDTWADKLYLLEGTDDKLLVDNSVEYKDNETILPVLAYDNVHVLDENGERLAISKSSNNCIAVDGTVDMNSISVVYEEPVVWRICEMVSLITLIGIIVTTFIKKKE